MTSAAATPAPAVEFRGVAKRFGSVRANEDITFSVPQGTIHGIIGENGAGKSTAMKMLYGLYRPDAGRIFVRGEEAAWRSPQDAIRAGIGMVHQHFMLAGPYTVLDNIILGAEPRSKLGLLDRDGARKKLEALSTRYGLKVPLDEPVEALPVGVQQRIEILKTLYRGADILILDEPTAVLTPTEVDELLRNLKLLKGEGKTILIITHKLKEVMNFTDDVTVFRAGRVSGGVKTADANVQMLADLMVGRRVNFHLEVPPIDRGEAVLEARDLKLVRQGLTLLDGLSLEVRAGEIVGIAGVEGNGQSELIQALLHPCEKTARTSGQVRILGKDVTEWRTRRILGLGVGLVPEDRHHEGLLLEQSVESNFILGQQREYAWHSWLRRKWIRAAVQRAVEAFDIRPRAPSLKMRALSGGNQQKVIIAREFERNPKVLVAAQPTRGVDVGAIEFIHQRILDARSRGVGVLLVSSELDEILALSDRILVMYAGRILAEYRRGEATERDIGVRMGGGAAFTPAAPDAKREAPV